MNIRLLCPWDSPGKNTGVGCQCPPPGDLPDPSREPALFCLLHWQPGSFSLAPPWKPYAVLQRKTEPESQEERYLKQVVELEFELIQPAVVLEKTPESPLGSKEIKPVNLKGNQP